MMENVHAELLDVGDTYIKDNRKRTFVRHNRRRSCRQEESGVGTEVDRS